MNPDEVIEQSVQDLGYDVTNSVLTIGNGGLTGNTILGGNNLISSVGAVSGTISANWNDTQSIEEFLDTHIMSRVTVDHKVQEHELLKLRETAPDYASEIKEIIAKQLARDVSKKITYTKKHDKDTDVHHFIGRVWVFTEEELKQFIKEAKNVN